MATAARTNSTMPSARTCWRSPMEPSSRSRTASRTPPRTCRWSRETKEDYGGNHVILQIAPDVFALYVHLHTGSVAVKVGDVVKAGTPLAKIGNTGPSKGPHLHFGLHDRPDFFAARSLPFVFDSYTLVGHGGFRRLGGGSRGDRAGFAGGSVRLSALRQHPEFSLARAAITLVQYSGPRPNVGRGSKSVAARVRAQSST